MKLCPDCGQLLAEEIATCPSCGSRVGEGRRTIDDYRILEVLHEGYSSILCRAVQEGSETPVMIRIFTAQSGVDARIAERLRQELEPLSELPQQYFVRHREIRQSADGLWYRISEWVEAENWGRIFASGRLQDLRLVFNLVARIASILEGLHRSGHFIPHLILDDIIVVNGTREELAVKIDYKLSRFLDPRMKRPGPMLKKLLAVHPDIIHQHPLDQRSDMWSLGKIFVELLTGDPEVTDFQSRINEMALPHEVRMLINIMMADDRELRPRSMAQIAETLLSVTEEDIRTATPVSRVCPPCPPSPQREIRALTIRIRALAIGLLVLVVLGVGAGVYFSGKKKDSATLLEEYANQYAPSVAFVVAEYMLKDDDAVVYRNITEGTAFLVDRRGYLLTNRHVACPWLEDRQLYRIINRLKQLDRRMHLEHRVFLWFEGERAFKRLPGLIGAPNLEDVYFIQSAYTTEGFPRLTIAGVARAPEKTWQTIKSPLKDDFAVLKIDDVPDQLTPLPLNQAIGHHRIPRLAPVIALGFPLGSRTQEASVNVSVTQGNVRRTFENFIQVDTSIYRGNSGGPIIDTRGRVIGIASRVAMEMAEGPLPMATLLSDIGMVLPVDKAAVFLDELRQGKTKWSGLLDLAIDRKLRQITDLGRQKRWQAAAALADQFLSTGLDPSMVMAGGVMHFCAQDYGAAGRLFEKALSMDAENEGARLMLFLIDWLTDRDPDTPYRRRLLELDWRSPHEFFGYLVRVMEGDVDRTAALEGGYTENEKSWLCLAASLLYVRERRLDQAADLLHRALLTARPDAWASFIALSRLDAVLERQLARSATAEQRERLGSAQAAFNRKIQEIQAVAAGQTEKDMPLQAVLADNGASPEKKCLALEQLLANRATAGNLLEQAAWYCAMAEQWENAFAYAERFLAIKGRESGGRLGVGLLAPGLLRQTGRTEEARFRLDRFVKDTRDPWYRGIARSLLEQQPEQDLLDKTGESPDYLLTAHVAMAFWAEADDRKKALRHYKEALGSYMDDRIEYAFARQGIKRLRRMEE